MKTKSIAPRYVIQEFGNGIQITLPSKKNFFGFLWFGIWIILWGYITGAFIYVGVTISTLVYNTSSFGVSSLIFISFISFLIACMLFMGASGFYSVIWKIAGKEIIEANGQTLTVTKCIFNWKRKKEYASGQIENLRVNVITPHRLTAPYRAIQKMLGHDGIINFSYNRQSIRFGLDISEDEGSYIVSTIKSRINN